MRRREFLKAAGSTTMAVLASRSALGAAFDPDVDQLHISSPFMEAQLSATVPEFVSLNIDGLGKGRRGPNMIAGRTNVSGYQLSIVGSGGAREFQYRVDQAGGKGPPAWAFVMSENRITLTSHWSGEFEPAPFVFHFNLNQVHSTVLGLFQKDGLLDLPALMHFPGQGSMRLTTDAQGIAMTYTSDRPHQAATLTLPAASFNQQRVSYTLEVTAIYPELPGLVEDSRFDPFRRNWLDVLQLNPELQALANNSASDTCAFCYYEYADIAALTPALAGRLTAVDLVRQTLDRMLNGGVAYGLPAIPDRPAATSDTYPAMVIAAGTCARADASNHWLSASYAGIRDWTESMLSTDINGNGLIKYALSGNSNSWGGPGFPKLRPSNWWDTIGFGYEDAYGNALAYRAYREMAWMARTLNKTGDASRYTAAAEKLRGVYYQHFYNPETGVLGGWRSADGQLHDYYFLWVNGIAIYYGLLDKPQANAILDKLLAKMKEVGYDKFNMGLPGNLVTVALKDYVHRTPDGRYGGGVLPDNSDGFQNYENGGATASFAFFLLAALYQLGRTEEADRILFPMLEEYGRCGFEGRDKTGKSYDWRRWDGTAMGYEGLLTDNYYALLAVAVRQNRQAGYGRPHG